MISVSLQHTSLLDIAGETADILYHGFDQEWYPTAWQRRSGCGPTVVSQSVFYFSRSRQPADAPADRPAKSAALALMEDVWHYVTPTARGIPSARLLREDFEKYARARNLPLHPECLDVPRRRSDRPELRQVLEFIDRSLRDDMPVAFLNLHNGSEPHLDSWHWVLIVALPYEADGSAALAAVLDEGVKKRIDLSLWFATTALGGGFVRFRPQ